VSDLVVVLDAPELGARRAVGVLSHWEDSRAIAFSYGRSWLNARDSFPLEPRLPLVEGRQYMPFQEPPPILRDTSPDLWGQILLERRARRHLSPWELLIGVTDETRIGALRLRQGLDGPFLDDREPSVPPIAQLRELETAARAIDEDPQHPIDRELALLVAPGSSLGGGRPKSNFRDMDGSLRIAKFPSRTDRQDSAAWEFVYAELAHASGIEVPEHRLLRPGVSRGRTYLARRFDRVGSDRRLYGSAMTLAEKRDGDVASYVDIARAIRIHGAPATVKDDLAQLFRRLVFNVLAGNRDDHLRNHAFLRGPSGWRLAPAFDMNPGREQRDHAISLDGSVSSPDLLAAVATHRLYGLSEPDALVVVREVSDVLGGWRGVASRTEITGPEQEIVGGAFAALASAFDLVGSP
jgi:serine/threonine-protein kinase HipA